VTGVQTCALPIYNSGFDIYKFYEAQYNVELFRNPFGVVEQVIFPSEEDALLFLLRWN